MEPYILIVDADEVLAGVVAVVLESIGYDVVTVSDGAAALAQVATHPPSIVLLEVQLPSMSGWDVFQQLREQGVLVPVVFMSRSAVGALMARLRGSDGFVGKPVVVGELLRAIRPFLPTAAD